MYPSISEWKFTILIKYFMNLVVDEDGADFLRNVYRSSPGPLMRFLESYCYLSMLFNLVSLILCCLTVAILSPSYRVPATSVGLCQWNRWSLDTLIGLNAAQMSPISPGYVLVHLPFSFALFSKTPNARIQQNVVYVLTTFLMREVMAGPSIKRRVW